MRRANKSTTIALSPENHKRAHDISRQWMKEKTGRPVGGKINWKELSPREIQGLSDRMMDAVGVPTEKRIEFYNALHQYLYSL